MSIHSVKQVSERTVPVSMRTSRVVHREEANETNDKFTFVGMTAFSASSVALACHGIMTGSMAALSFGAAPFALFAVGVFGRAVVESGSECGWGLTFGGVALAAVTAACNAVGLAAIGAAGGSIALTSIAGLSIAALPLTYLAVQSDLPLTLHENGWL